MKIAFLINDYASLMPSQTTWMLMSRAVAREHSVVALTVTDLSLTPDGELLANARSVRPDSTCASLSGAPTGRVSLNNFDAVLIRTNPARDVTHRWAHESALQMLALLELRGVLVLNRPEGLARANTKLYLHWLPAAVRPETLVTSDAEQLVGFVRSFDGESCILKPASGTRGRGVFMVDADSANLMSIAEMLAGDGLVLAQEFVPGAVDGDVRVLLVDGELLRVGEHICAVRRLPGADDFRSNIHVGGQPVPAELTPEMRETIAQVGPLLRRDGLFLVGLDLIEAKIIEVNVFSPGGFRDAERFTGCDFTGAVIARLEALRAQ